MRSRRWRTAVAGAALGAALATTPAGAQEVYTASGPDPASIQATVDEFRAALGALNPNTAGTAFFGRREINWDGVPDQFAAPNELPADFFNVTSPRGAVFSEADGFMVSADSDNPTATAPEFGNLNPDYPAQFETFSPQRLFTSLGTPDYVVEFRIPGEDVPAVTRGFGAVFTDVDDPGETSIELLAPFGGSYGSFAAPTAPGGLSFVGAVFPPGFAGVGAVVVRQGTAVPGAADDDAVAADDFIYGEPTINCGGRTPSRVGTEGDDALAGTPGPDTILGLGGRDRISGGAGDDAVCGGPGADTVTGGAGDDFVDGADETTVIRFFEQGLDLDAADRLQGDGGSDIVLGFAGADRQYGGTGNDEVLGELGADRLRGGPGHDGVVGAGNPEEPDDDLLVGDGGDDFLLDSGGDDAAHGGAGDDQVHTGAGDDFAHGGDGSDLIGLPFEFADNTGAIITIPEDGDDVFLGGHGADLLDGGPDTDHLNGEQDVDQCLNGEILRNCEDTGAPVRSAAARGAAGAARGFDSRY